MSDMYYNHNERKGVIGGDITVVVVMIKTFFLPLELDILVIGISYVVFLFFFNKKKL